MNCDDIALLLDDGDLGTLEEAARGAVAKHLAACPDCAREWRSFGDFSAIAQPAVPAGLVARCRAMASPIAAESRRRNPRSRLILGGAVLAIAAAAATLALRGRDAGSAGVDQARSAALAAGEPVQRLVVPVPGQDSAVIQDDEPQPAGQSPQAQNTVLVVLQNEATDAATHEAVEQFHAAVLRELRGIPGMTVVLSAEPDADKASGAELHIVAAGRQSTNGGRFWARLTSTNLGPKAGQYASMTSREGAISPACVPDPSSTTPVCIDPAGLAASMVAYVRGSYFPDASLERQMRAQLLDAGLDPARRQEVLVNLAMLGAGKPGDRTGAKALSDPAVVRGVADLAGSVSDPQLRASVWRSMMRVRTPEFRQALVTASRQDPDPRVRVATISMLSWNFDEDPQATQFLEERASLDPQPLVRAVAMRATKGEEAWRDYVVTSLRDETRTPEERIEAFLHHTVAPGLNPGGYASAGAQAYQGLLDQQATTALAEVLPRVTTFPYGPRMKYWLLNEIHMQVRDPAITRMLLAVLQDSTDRTGQTMVMQALDARLSGPMVRGELDRFVNGEPGVRAALERFVNDPDPALRDIAVRVLSQASASRP